MKHPTHSVIYENGQHYVHVETFQSDGRTGVWYHVYGPRSGYGLDVDSFAGYEHPQRKWWFQRKERTFAEAAAVARARCNILEAERLEIARVLKVALDEGSRGQP